MIEISACIVKGVFISTVSSCDRAGVSDKQANVIGHVIPIVALKAGSPDLYPLLDNAIRVVQNDNKAVAFGMAVARILEKVIVRGIDGLISITSLLVLLQI